MANIKLTPLHQLLSVTSRFHSASKFETIFLKAAKTEREHEGCGRKRQNTANQSEKHMTPP